MGSVPLKTALTFIPLDGTLPELNDTDKVFLPSSVLTQIIDTEDEPSSNPLVFLLNGKTYVGVKEFTSEEGTIRIPRMVSDEMKLKPGDTVTVESVVLEKGTDLTLSPLDFSLSIQDIDTWVRILEAQLPRSFTVLSCNQVISLRYDGKTYKFLVKETKPASAICIINTDLNLFITDIHPTDGTQSTNSELSGVQASAITVGNPVTVPVSGCAYFCLSLAAEDAKQSSNLCISAKCEAEWFDVFAGHSVETCADCFAFSTVEGSAAGQKQLNIPLDSFLALPEPCIYITVQVSDPTVLTLEAAYPAELPGVAEPVSAPEGSQQCENCLQYIPTQSYALHSGFCARNNVRCSQCGQLFLRHIPESHWHCDLCSAHGNSDSSEQHHHIFHQPAQCLCGRHFDSHIAYARHRDGTECPLKLHECRFCHLQVPRGPTNATAALLGFSDHEYECGSRTTECDICGKVVRLRDLQAHTQLHEMGRKQRQAPRLCRNRNCINVLPAVGEQNNSLGLCAACFAACYSAVHDPDGSRLRSRIERRYVIQLTKGCGKSWCANPYCKSSGLLGPKKSMAEVMAIVKKLMAEVPNSFYFCVSENMKKKKMALQMLEELSAVAGQYDAEWLAAAIDSTGIYSADGGLSQSNVVNSCSQWLARNAVRKTEVV